jgi:hypothetical protein
MAGGGWGSRRGCRCWGAGRRARAGVWCAASGEVSVAVKRLAGCVATALRCSVADDATASFDARGLHRSGAGSSSGEGSPWAEQEVLAGAPAGRTSTITTRQKFLRADPGLEAAERGWNGLPPSATAATPRTARVGQGYSSDIRQQSRSSWGGSQRSGKAQPGASRDALTQFEVEQRHPP